MTTKPTYKELIKRVQELESIAFEQKQVKEKLLEEKHFSQTLLQAAPVLFVAINAKGKTIMINKIMLDTLGYKHDEVIGKNYITTFVPNRDRKKLSKVFDKLIRFNEPTLNENYITTKDGKELLIEWHGRSVFNKQGEFNFFFGFGIDITERKKTVNALKKSEVKFRNLYNNAQVGLARTSMRTGKVLTCNDKMAQIFNYENTDEFINDYIFSENYVDPKVRELMVNKVKKFQLVNNVEAEFYGKDKSKVWARFDTRFYPDKGYMEDVVVDITERRIGENALRESEKRFRDLTEMLPEAVFETNAEMILTYVNKQALSLFGYTKEDFKKKLNCLDMLAPKERERATKNIAKRIHSKEPGKNEYIGLRKDGSTFPVLLHASPIMDQGVFKGFRGIIIDINEIKVMEEKIQQAQKMESIGTLAGGIAHDFNNILFPILGYTEMLLQDVPAKSPLQNSLNGIYISALRAKDLVKQILTFSRQERNELKLIRVQQIIKEALKLIRSSISKSIKIKMDIQADCGAIKADPTQIHQIVMNLTTNAYHAMEKTGGQLSVSLKEIKLGKNDVLNPDMIPGRYACLTITDTGIGMDKELTQKIFDPFFTTKEKGKGTGMGLSVVHGIVISMNGAIQVDSRPGKGTQFDVYLPVKKELLPEKKFIKSAKSIKGGIERVLLVDDDESIIIMEKRVLERLGYKVTSYIDSLEALEAFRDGPDKFDLVITDMDMPNMPGDILSTELIKIRPDISILICTGFSETMSEEKAASLGIKGFLMKPMVMMDLAQKIREVL